MGYTHYLQGKEKILPDPAFAGIVHAMSQALCRLAEINSGVPSLIDDDCNFPETRGFLEKRDADGLERLFMEKGAFHLTLKDMETLSVRKGRDEGWADHWFSCCKTSRIKPMDDMVAALMMVAARASEGFLEFSSDGDRDDLAAARKLAGRIEDGPKRLSAGIVDTDMDARMDTVQCIWEYALVGPKSERLAKAMDRCSDANGIAATRMALRNPALLDACEEANQLYGEDFSCYDWDLVPCFLENCLDEELNVKADWKDIMRNPPVHNGMGDYRNEEDGPEAAL